MKSYYYPPMEDTKTTMLAIKTQKESFLFEKISKDQWIKDSGVAYEYLEKMKMPRRATHRSAGYDFFSAGEIRIPAHTSVMVPTGLKCYIEGNYFLGIYPKSGIGCKYGLRLLNTVGIVDADYYNNESNEGHILIHYYNPSDQDVVIEKGKAYCQAIIQPFGVVVDDNMYEKEIRTGGHGSTNS